MILTKPLGVGVYSAAIKKGALSSAGYDEMIATTTLLNSVGAELAKDAAVHAITDVTGFGLLGHTLEMSRNSKITLVIRVGDLPLLSQAATLAQQGFQTSGGLLISCAPECAEAIVRSIAAAGHVDARVIGLAKSGPPLVMVDIG
jgi:selenide,water dikinase